MGNQILRYGMLGALAAISLTSCVPRFKGVESYDQATTPNQEGNYVMDPYSYGGTAEGSGGLRPAASYGSGASVPGQPGKADRNDGNQAHYDEIAKLTGPKPVNWGVDPESDGSAPRAPAEGSEGKPE